MQLGDVTPRATLDRVDRLLTTPAPALASCELAGQVEATLCEACGQLLALEARAARTSTSDELASSLRERLAALRARAHPAVGSPGLATSGSGS